jgi:hypothetical protein
MPSIARRYQQRDAVRRSVVQRMESWIRQLETALDRLHRVPLDGAAYRVFYKDIVDRYQMIGRVFSAYPDLAVRIAEVEARLQRDAEAVAGPAPVILAEAECNPLLGALDDLVVFLENPGTLHPISEELRHKVSTHLRERRAELLVQRSQAGYRERRAAKDLPAAEAHLQRALDYLQAQAPDTPRVKELRQQVARLLHPPRDDEAAADARRAS